MIKTILVVDDDKLMRSFLSSVLMDEGYYVEEANNGKTAIAKLQSSEFDIILTDLKMPDMSGIELMSEGKIIKPGSRWIIITAYGSISNAVEAIKEGAADYLTKPLRNPDELRHVIKRVLDKIETEQTISLLSEEIGKQFPPFDMIFLGDRMKDIYQLVRSVAATPATVLISGSSGTGKELVARVIHKISPRGEKAFVPVNCGSLVDTLLESELFGHERGAFTGAVNTRKGKFELADGGTIFLDEIGEISPAVQVKLLRVLQERTFERLGGMKSLQVDIRIIAATNKNLKDEVSSGRFREDLFYRLNVFPVNLPALTERREAIIPISEFFIRKFSVSLGKKVTGLTDKAKLRLHEYEWPGNIRELQNVIERAVILSEGFIDEEHLNLDFPSGSLLNKEGLLHLQEKELIRKTLEEMGGNRKKTAQVLGISLRTLQYRIKEYGLL